MQTSDLDEEPKYKIRIRDGERSAEKKVSTAQVQFWPQYVENFKRSVAEKTHFGSPAEVIRVDLLTGNYHPNHIKRLDK